MPSLDQLRPGQRGRITAIQGDDALMQRLLEMGLLEGQELEVLSFAPLGDPLEIRLGDYRLSLRRREAARVLVEEDTATEWRSGGVAE
ncbi:MAG TPA: FeoA family protein [Gemmataceae bacterium]|jgi:Fe2+ transport system protein FeoA